MLENYNDVISLIVLVVIIIVLGRYTIIMLSKGRLDYLKNLEDEYYNNVDDYIEEDNDTF